MAMDLAVTLGPNSAATRTPHTAKPTTFREVAETILKPAVEE